MHIVVLRLHYNLPSIYTIDFILRVVVCLLLFDSSVYFYPFYTVHANKQWSFTSYTKKFNKWLSLTIFVYYTCNVWLVTVQVEEVKFRNIHSINNLVIHVAYTNSKGTINLYDIIPLRTLKTSVTLTNNLLFSQVYFAFCLLYLHTHEL